MQSMFRIFFFRPMELLGDIYGVMIKELEVLLKVTRPYLIVSDYFSIAGKVVQLMTS